MPPPLPPLLLPVAVVASLQQAGSTACDDFRCPAGFDATAMVPFLQRNSLFSLPGGATTSVVDVEELIAAAKEELRQAGRTQKMPS